jgi:hypothetical protein
MPSIFTPATFMGMSRDVLLTAACELGSASRLADSSLRLLDNWFDEEVFSFDFLELRSLAELLVDEAPAGVLCSTGVLDSSFDLRTLAGGRGENFDPSGTFADFVNALRRSFAFSLKIIEQPSS